MVWGLGVITQRDISSQGKAKAALLSVATLKKQVMGGYGNDLDHCPAEALAGSYRRKVVGVAGDP